MCRPIGSAGYGWDAPRPQAFHIGISAGPCGDVSRTWQVWGYAYYGIYSGDGFFCVIFNMTDSCFSCMRG